MAATNGGPTPLQGGALVHSSRVHATWPARTPDRRRRLRRRGRSRGGRPTRRRPGAGCADDQHPVHGVGGNPAAAREVRRRADRRAGQRPRRRRRVLERRRRTSGRPRSRAASPSSAASTGGAPARTSSRSATASPGSSSRPSRAPGRPRSSSISSSPSGCGSAPPRSTRSARPIRPPGPPARRRRSATRPATARSCRPANNGRVQVKITGSFPHPLGPGRPLHAAERLGDDRGRARHQRRPGRTTNHPMRWDIHDDSLKTEQHVAGECLDGPADGHRGRGRQLPRPAQRGRLQRRLRPVLARLRRSRQRRRGPGRGAVRPAAPADAAERRQARRGRRADAGRARRRRDRARTPRAGINGAGALEKADKTEVYSRDGNGTASPHNLYAPYYVQWIPGDGRRGRQPARLGHGLVVPEQLPGRALRACTTTGTCTR